MPKDVVRAVEAIVADRELICERDRWRASPVSVNIVCRENNRARGDRVLTTAFRYSSSGHRYGCHSIAGEVDLVLGVIRACLGAVVVLGLRCRGVF